MIRRVRVDSRGPGPNKVFPRDSEIFRQGEEANEVYLITGETVRLLWYAADGRELILGVRSRGWILGATAVLLKEPYPCCAIALRRSLVRPMAADTFQNLVGSDFEFSLYVHRMTQRELYDETRRMINLGGFSAKSRLRNFLRELVSDQAPERSNREVAVELPLKYCQIACYLRLTPGHLCRLLKELERQGLIRERRGGIVVLDLLKFSESL